jgi:hypothetical protein
VVKTQLRSSGLAHPFLHLGKWLAPATPRKPLLLLLRRCPLVLHRRGARPAPAARRWFRATYALLRHAGSLGGASTLAVSRGPTRRASLWPALPEMELWSSPSLLEAVREERERERWRSSPPRRREGEGGQRSGRLLASSAGQQKRGRPPPPRRGGRCPSRSTRAGRILCRRQIDLTGGGRIWCRRHPSVVEKAAGGGEMEAGGRSKAGRRGGEGGRRGRTRRPAGLPRRRDCEVEADARRKERRTRGGWRQRRLE